MSDSSSRGWGGEPWDERPPPPDDGSGDESPPPSDPTPLEPVDETGPEEPVDVDPTPPTTEEPVDVDPMPPTTEAPILAPDDDTGAPVEPPAPTDADPAPAPAAPPAAASEPDAPAAEEPETAEPDVEPESAAAAPVPGRLRRLMDNERLGWIVAGVASVAAVLAVIAALIVTSWWAPLHAEARDREAVRSFGETFTVHLATFSGATIDEWVARTEQQATGTYAEQVAQLFDDDLRDALRDLEVESQGELIDLYVQELEGDQAMVFAVVRQTVSNAVADQPFEDELRMEIELTRENDRWLASNVAVLGPAQPGLPAPGTQQEEVPPAAEEPREDDVQDGLIEGEEPPPVDDAAEPEDVEESS